jgi:3-hydroxyisobutyrate dehydrogenase-like beta-hydroxyacid dehydrogenase
VDACGSGNKIELLNQMMFDAINAMTAEMLAVADRMGIEHRVLYDTIVESRAATVSNLFVELGRKVLEESYRDSTFTVDLLCKDTRLAIETAKEHHALPLLAQLVQYINESARMQGFGGSDTAVMWKVFQNMWRKSATE